MKKKKKKKVEQRSVHIFVSFGRMFDMVDYELLLFDLIIIQIHVSFP